MMYRSCLIADTTSGNSSLSDNHISKQLSPSKYLNPSVSVKNKANRSNSMTSLMYGHFDRLMNLKEPWT